MKLIIRQNILDMYKITFRLYSTPIVFPLSKLMIFDNLLHCNSKFHLILLQELQLYEQISKSFWFQRNFIFES